jgi:ketosteroid isomerase-like protein
VGSENVDVVRRAYEAFNGGDLERLLALLDPGVHVDMSARVFNPAEYDGHDGVRRLHREIFEVWEEFRWEPEDVVGGEDQVIAVVRSYGRGRGSGITIDRRIAFHWTMRDGRGLAIKLYVDPAEALALLPSRA